MLGRRAIWKFTLLGVLASVFLFGSTNISIADDPGDPDSLIVGNFDGTPILAGLNTQIVVPIYIRTDDSVSFLHIPVATNDDYIVSRDGGVFYEPLSLWDDVSFLSPDFDSPSVGHTSQSILGFAFLVDPRDPQNFLYTNGEWVYIADYHMTTTDNITVLGDTTELIEGYNLANGDLYFGLSDGITQVDPQVVWGKIYFPPNTPPIFIEPAGGTMPVNEQFGICLTVTATDEDEDDLILTVDFEPTDYTFEELINEPGLISYEFCWVPQSGSAGTYPLTFTVNDGAGGVINLDIIFEVTPTGLIIASSNALPGSAISLAVSLENEGISSAVGAFEILIDWEYPAMTLNSVIQAGRIGNFEYFFVNYNDSGEGTVRVVGIADLSFGDPTPPLQPGTGPIFFLDFSVSEDEDLIGIDLPVEFLILDQTDNTLSDSTGYLLVHPELTNGIVSVVGPEDVLTGDINLNGIPYEVGDIVLFVNHLTNPSDYPFDPVQMEASDINADGIPATVADLVLLINIVNGSVPPPRLDPFQGNVLITAVRENGTTYFRANSDRDLGGVLMKLAHDPDITPMLSSTGEFTIAYHDDGEIMTVLAYLPDGGGVAAGMSNLFRIEGIDGTLDIDEVSASDASGWLLNVASRFDAPLPTTYRLAQNYPNPFNANTKISFDLPEPGPVKLDIYNISGQKIGTLFDDFMEAGRYGINWDGSDYEGNKVSSGIYFYRLNAGSVTKTMKMTLLK